MHLLLRLISYAGLVLTIVPAILVYLGRLDHGTHTTIMIAGMLMWFGAALFWIKPDRTGT
jgi:hypothetical protein